MATSTTYTTFEKLAFRGDEAVLIVKLMMAFNDLSLANEGLSLSKKELQGGRGNRSRGAAMYFIRLQASHLYEAMKTIDAIAVSERLNHVVARGSARSRTAFERLKDIRRNPDQKRRFERLVGRLRNNVTFHYDQSGELIERAIKRRASNAVGNHTSITRGTEPYSWHFKIADDVVDSIVCREIWKIPEGANLREEADAAADYGHQIFVDFADFVSDFVVRCLTDAA